MEVFLIKADMIINDAIRAKEVRVVSSEGEQLGIMDRRKAMDMAREQDMDLVLIAPKGIPPVCKIMDYGKYRFEMAKREKEAKKKQNIIEVKEVRLSATIEEHDINVRLKHAKKFLSQGNKVKVGIRFKGRQMAHTEMGFKVMQDFAKRLDGIAVVESRPKLEGRNMSMMLGPVQQKPK